MHPTLKTEIFSLLEARILAGKQATGRTGMNLWQILVLGVPAAPWGEEAKRFGHQTLRDNVALLDDELLQQINAAVGAAGREVFAKRGGA